ncbi:hypothetical protein KCU93_g5257, partial [Aureobasidium melanogenum]
MGRALLTLTLLTLRLLKPVDSKDFANRNWNSSSSALSTTISYNVSSITSLPAIGFNSSNTTTTSSPGVVIIPPDSTDSAPLDGSSENGGGPPQTGPPGTPTNTPIVDATPTPPANPGSTPIVGTTPVPSPSPGSTPIGPPGVESPTPSWSLITSTESSSSTSQSSCTSSCTPGCLPPLGSVLTDVAWTTTEIENRRSVGRDDLAGRIALSHQKRATASTISSFATCMLPLSVTRPAYFSPTDMLNADLQGDLQPPFAAISRYDKATASGCVFTTTRLTANEFRVAPSWADITGKYQKDNRRASVDHAYEVHWLKDFMTFLIDPSRFSCTQFIQIYFPQNNACQENLLQPIFDALASDENPDFLILSVYLNQVKAALFPLAAFWAENDDDWWLSPQTISSWHWHSGDDKSVKDLLSSLAKQFERILYGTLEMQADNMLPMIDKTNNRIYAALLHFDVLLSQNANGMFGDTTAIYNQLKPTTGLAEAYKYYMTTMVQPQINLAPWWLTRIFSVYLRNNLAMSYSLPEVIANSNGYEKDDVAWWQIWFNRHETYYRSGDGYTWDYYFEFSWDTTGLQERFAERLFSRNDSCPLPEISDTTAAPTSSSSSSALESSFTTTSTFQETTSTLESAAPTSGLTTSTTESTLSIINSTTTVPDSTTSSSVAACTSWSTVTIATPDSQGDAGMLDTTCVDPNFTPAPTPTSTETLSSTDAPTAEPTSAATSTTEPTTSISDSATSTPSSTSGPACISWSTITIATPDSQGDAGMEDSTCLEFSSTPTSTLAASSSTQSQTPTSTSPSAPTYTASNGATKPGAYEFWVLIVQVPGPVVGASPPTIRSTLTGYDAPLDDTWYLCDTTEDFADIIPDSNMPADLPNVIHVFADVCGYSQSSNFATANQGDAVGSLNCGEYAPATCRKLDTGHTISCPSGVGPDLLYIPLVKCDWT